MISLPRALATDSTIDPRAKALYISVIAHKPRSIRELATCVAMDRVLVTKLLAILVKTEWIIIEEVGGRKIIIPTMPPEIQKHNLDYIRDCERMTPRSGEYKMYLRFHQIIDVSPFIYSARPWFLQNSNSGEFLEYDIYSPEASLAGEFLGRQHFELTNDYPNKASLEKLKARDELKARLSKEHNVVLINITAEDLTLENMLKKIPKTVPIKLIDVNGIYARGLDEMCLRYIAYCQRGKARDERRVRR